MERPADITWRGYSLAERDRRWAAVRARAADAGFACIFVPKGNQPDARYLTQFVDAVFILPTDGRAPIAFVDHGRGNDWVPDPRPPHRSMRAAWGGPIAEALIELGMERARIGVAGLGVGTYTHVRAADGVLNHGAYMEVLRRLPNASFEDATDLVGLVRYVKSDEEIACLRRATAISEAGIDEIVEVARPGIDEAYLYARVTARMLELGSENCHWALKTGLVGGEEPRRYTEPPIGRRLQHGTLITNEVGCSWGGIGASDVQPVLLGPVPETWKPIIDLQREAVEVGLERLQPGTPLPEFIEFFRRFGGERGRITIGIHGRGWGDDGPLVTSRAEIDKLRDVRIEKGTTWVWKPTAQATDRKVDFQWGGSVVVTERGGESLSQRAHGLVSIA